MRFLTLLPILLLPLSTPILADSPQIEIWHGDQQRVGHLGRPQGIFNVMGHIADWQEVETLTWEVDGRFANPMQFHAFRRLVADGDFNADIPIDRLRIGKNKVTIRARYRDGSEGRRSITVTREAGACPLPFAINWAQVSNPQDVGQYVDGHWEKTPEGLRTTQVGYDRLFLIGDETWRDYDVFATITIHDVPAETSELSGGNGVGIICRFTGHVVGGPRSFPSAQPAWGYQPFGAIGWLRWHKGDPTSPALLQFYPGDSDRATDYGEYAPGLEEKQCIRMTCRSLPDSSSGAGVTAYQFKIWPASEPEPENITWGILQSSEHALRSGPIALVAHHVDVTFGDISVTLLENRGRPPATAQGR